ncbi:MAG TPA: universal stress protein [Chloroflexota bacterium]|nr:universal stress protein [Chloroflexota bacterium]
MATTQLEPLLGTPAAGEDPGAEGAGTTFRRIVVPLDGSRLAAAALAPAAEIAAHTGAPVLVVHAIAPVSVPDVDPQTALSLGETDGRVLLERAVGQLRDARVRADELLVLPAKGEAPDPAQAVLTALRRTRDADLVVMTTHGRVGVRRAVVGSVADGVIRHGHVPVLLVPAAALDGRSVRLAPEDTAELPATILVCLDGSALADAALGPAAALASAIGAGMTLVRVIPQEYLLLAPGYGTPATQRAAEVALSERADALTDKYPHLPFVRTAALVAESHAVAHAILGHAAESGARVIALATHARAGVRRLVLGSLTAALVKAARVPVLVVPPAGGGGARARPDDARY